MGRTRRDSKVEKWERDLEVIKDEVLGIHHNRNVYRTVGKIVDDNGGLPPSLFFNYAQGTYAVTQCAAVRRQAEIDPSRVVSLGSLLAEIAAEPEKMTRARYVALHTDPDPYFEQLGEDTFTKLFAGDVGDYIDPEIVQKDLEELRAAADAVEKHTDRHIAHRDRSGAKAMVTFGDIDKAIDMIGEIFRKYALLFTAASYMTLEPVIQENWLAVFREPWIREGA